MGVNEIVQIERYLKFYSIAIYDGEYNEFNNNNIYTSPSNRYFINILYNLKNFMKKIFDFQKECLSYCTSDQDLLMKGCLSFSENMIKITISDKFPTGIDAFTSAITIGKKINTAVHLNSLKKYLKYFINQVIYK